LTVASNGDEGIVGFMATGPERGHLESFQGEIYALYLLKGWQGKGWGGKLFQIGLDQLVQAGYQNMALWVLRDNPARGFYEHMGGRIVGEQRIEIGGAWYVEVAYGWPDLSSWAGV
jgi:ribosomal protein S18 acetylase RimI-like enzyme